MSKKITALIPGAALALGIACIAKWLETLESSAGLHLIGASVIALVWTQGEASDSPLKKS